MSPTTADDLTQQKKLAEDQKRQTEQLITKQKELLRQRVTDLDKQITILQAQRTAAASDLSKLG